MKTKNNFLRTGIAIYAVALIVPTAAGAQIKRTDLQRHDLEATGYEAIQVRVDFEQGAAFGMHAHPGEEIIYVLEGSIEYEIEGQAPVIVKAGEVLFIPAGKYHSAKNVGNTAAAELATYTVQKGKPLLVMKK